MTDLCTVTRCVFVRVRDLATQQEREASWKIEACRTPLFSAEERKTGTCRACKNGWSAPYNFPVQAGTGFEVWAERLDGSEPVLVVFDAATEPVDAARVADLWLGETRAAGVVRVTVWSTDPGTAGRMEPFAGDGKELARSEAIPPALCPRCSSEVDGPHVCADSDFPAGTAEPRESAPSHRALYPEQYEHPLCGLKVTVEGSTGEDGRPVSGTVARVVPSSFGPLAILEEYGAKQAWLVASCKPVAPGAADQST